MNVKALTAAALSGLSCPCSRPSTWSRPRPTPASAASAWRRCGAGSTEPTELHPPHRRDGQQERSVAGTVFSDGKPRIIQIKGINMEAELGPNMLYVTNRDRPGLIGRLGTLLGDAGLNIATFHLPRPQRAGRRRHRPRRDRRRRARRGSGAGARSGERRAGQAPAVLSLAAQAVSMRHSQPERAPDMAHVIHVGRPGTTRRESGTRPRPASPASPPRPRPWSGCASACSSSFPIARRQMPEGAASHRRQTRGRHSVSSGQVRRGGLQPRSRRGVTRT